MAGVSIKHRVLSIRRRIVRHDSLEEVLMFSVRKQSKAKLAVLSLALLSAAALSPVASAWAVDPSTAPSAPAANPTPINATAQGQMMNMQMAAMQNAAQNAPVDASFEGNVPKSTSLSANFGWMDTFDNSYLNGGYGGGVTATHWVTPHFGLTASIEIESFGFGPSSGTTARTLNTQSGTPIIPITLGGVYDFTGGKAWANPQIFVDAGPAVSLYGESMPLYADMGAGVVTPLAKISDTLAGIDIFANIRMAYLSNVGGAIGSNTLSTATTTYNQASMWYMPIEFGATFVF
jgi:hypothetical protein